MMMEVKGERWCRKFLAIIINLEKKDALFFMLRQRPLTKRHRKIHPSKKSLTQLHAGNIFEPAHYSRMIGPLFQFFLRF